jgi:ATP/maltotriose-dependent transcriptional regulator MalT
LLEAPGAFVVALAARRSWFGYHQLFAVLLELERRRTGLAEAAVLGRAFSWPRLRVLRHVASRRCAGLLPGRAW